MPDDSLDEGPIEPFFPPMGPPRDFHEIYMESARKTTEVSSFKKMYLLHLSLIRMGMNMLPDDYEWLRKKASEFLNMRTTYPDESKTESTDHGTYRMGTGSGNTGLVEVLHSDLEKGDKMVEEQQSASLLRRTQSILGDIDKALMESGILEVKKPSMEDLLIQDVMAAIQDKMMNIYTKEIEQSSVVEGEEDDS